jgi:hypothetical protein
MAVPLESVDTGDYYCIFYEYLDGYSRHNCKISSVYLDSIVITYGDFENVFRKRTYVEDWYLVKII